MHYLEPVSQVGYTEEDGENMEEEYDNAHFLYKHSDLIANHTCGYSGTPYHIFHNQEFNRILRYKRSAKDDSSSETIRGPYNANRRSRYVELVLVVDKREYKELGESLPKVYKHCKDIANIINALYVPLNIFVALVGVVVWQEHDEISLNENGDTTLTNFLHYRRGRLVKEHPNDNAQLLTRIQFKGGVVGKALKGPICTYEFSGGVSMDHSSVVGLVATTVAHEMGHNFGMEHDSAECVCPSERCIMAPSSSAMSPIHWSSCSLEYLALAFEHGMDYCLRNKPEKLFDSPVCGNGFVEAGEQCDCGLPQHCDNPCCVAETCMLVPNTSCATGQCCDLKTCKPKSAGTMCRSANHECDLPEYCTGQSEYCPSDVFKMDGETCNHGKAFCYQGSCRTHSDQCRLLWGPSGSSSDEQCYNMNTKGSRHGNCGYNRLNQSYNKCRDENVMCGMLHCKHYNERLEFGMESVSILSHSFINNGGSIIPCRTAIVDLGLNEVDPGLAPDGAKCGPGKMCVNQKCLPVESLVAGGANGKGCPKGCSGNGVCNSKNHCHCKKGFAPPYCDYPGPGGSEDSGPASDPNAGRKMMTALYVIFFGIVPVLAILAIMLYYTRPRIKSWWEKGGAFGFGERRVGDGLGQYVKFNLCRWNCSWFESVSRLCASKTGRLHAVCSNPKGIKGFCSNKNGFCEKIRKEKNKRGGAGGVRVLVEPSSPMSPGSGSGDGATTTLLPPGSTSLQSNLFGQHKGFTITPLAAPKLPSPPDDILPKNPAPPIPISPAASASNNTDPKVPPHRMAPPPPVAVSSTPASSAVATPVTSTSIVTANKRPIISNPILNRSSSTAKELISSAMGEEAKVPMVDVLKPQRRAPEAPPVQPRPMSSPVELKPIEVTVSSHDTIAPMGGSGGSSALSRIASILRPVQVGRSQSVNHQAGPKPNAPVKAAKVLDRQALRNLSISNPIPQQEIEIPQKVLPVSEAAANLTGGKPTVTRARSMRDGTVTNRPAIHSFGSMRGARPASIPSAMSIGTRPTSPPPRPPPPNISSIEPTDPSHSIPGLPGYQNPPSSKNEHAYDDCMSLKPAEDGRSKAPAPSAPLAHIEEEDSMSSPTSADNIYAVIQEVDDVSDSAKSPTNINSGYTSPTANEYQSPRPLEGSCESVGLLSEIVSEIQARNIESIYTSTLGRKKKQEERERKEREEAERKAKAAGANGKGGPNKPEKSVTFKTDKVDDDPNLQGMYVNTPSSSTSFQPNGSTFYSNVDSPEPLIPNAPAALPPKTLRSPPALSSSISTRVSPVSSIPTKDETKSKPNNPTSTINISATAPPLPAPNASKFTASAAPLKIGFPQRPQQLTSKHQTSTTPAVSSSAASNSLNKDKIISGSTNKVLSPQSSDASKISSGLNNKILSPQSSDASKISSGLNNKILSPQSSDVSKISSGLSKKILSPQSTDVSSKGGESSPNSVKDSSNEESANKNGEAPFSTFKGPLRTLGSPTPPTTTLTSANTYKPYSSSLQRSGGTVASYRSASNPPSTTAVPSRSAPATTSPPKASPPSISSTTLKSPSETSSENTNNCVNGGFASSSGSKGPDLVTSNTCTPNSASNIGKSPDVVLGA
ncbi:hypothetical protein J437_LFUL010823, partial [Ladona fulva]